MKNEIKRMTLSRALLAGMLDGFVTAILVVLFLYIYREITGFEKINALNPLLVFVGAPILLILAGGLYYLLVHFLLRGEALFIILFAASTIIGAGVVLNLNYTGSSTLLSVPHGLLFGTILICGLACCVILPYLAHHPRIYLTSGQMKWEDGN